MIYATHIVREEKSREVCRRLDYGFRPVRLPEHPDVPLWLVVVRASALVVKMAPGSGGAALA